MFHKQIQSIPQPSANDHRWREVEVNAQIVLRANPNRGSTPVMNLFPGEIVRFIGEIGNGWAAVLADGMIGFCLV